MSPPLPVSQVEHYFGNTKDSPAITEFVDMKNGVPLKTSVTNLYLTRAMQYRDHSAMVEQMDLVWEKMYEDIRRSRVLVCLLYTSPSPRDRG